MQHLKVCDQLGYAITIPIMCAWKNEIYLNVCVDATICYMNSTFPTNIYERTLGREELEIFIGVVKFHKNRNMVCYYKEISAFNQEFNVELLSGTQKKNVRHFTKSNDRWHHSFVLFIVYFNFNHNLGTVRERSFRVDTSQILK